MQRYVECKRGDLTLRGMAHIPENTEEKVPALLMIHGFTANKVGFSFQFVKIARELEKKGIAVFRFDFSGSGESDGEFKDVTLSNEIEDGLAIIDYIKSLDYIDESRISVMGMSFGGVVGSMLGGLRKDDIHSLFLSSSATTFVDDIKAGHVQGYKIDDEVRRKGYIDLRGHQVGIGYAEDALKHDIYGVASNFDKNVLLMHIEGDAMVPLDCSKKYLDIYGDKAELVVVPGDSHSYDSVEKIELLEAHMIDFFEKQFGLVAVQ